MDETPKTLSPEKKLWFKAKTYGYGWYPATWQGWGVMVLYVLGAIVAASDILTGMDGGLPAVKRFVLIFLALTLFLLYIAYTHGEKPRWQWGPSDKDHEKSDAA
jgi:hypothetical protein